MKTLSSVSLQDRIRSQLEQDIQDGKLMPGTPIDEKAVAASFNTSRTPVREALLRLSVHGLVDIIPRAGIYVHKLSASELVAMMEALGELEAVLARLAALRIGPAQRDELVQALAVTADRAAAQDAVGYQQGNAVLHEVIYRSSGNLFIVEQAKTVRLRIAAYRGRLFERPGRLTKSQAEHQKVVSCILSGQADGAAQAMREHISVGGSVFADLVLTNSLR